MPLTPIDEALNQVMAKLPRITESENVTLGDALGRILFEDCISAIDVPPHCNSAMDGYALRVSDQADQDSTLRIAQRIAAGEVGAELQSGEAARIFTGAPAPAGADAVVMQENCEVDGDILKIMQRVSEGENLRLAGDDIQAGATVLRAGRRLLPQDIGLLASIGLESVAVVRKLKVSLFTTGNELVQPGTPLSDGQIYNSNFYTLRSLLENLSVEVLDGGIVGDSFEETRTALLAAAEDSDCVITTGGVSVGEEDHVKAVVEAEGVIELWKLAIKPGKPLACGKIAGTQFFGLPGNPVSAFVTFVLVVRSSLLSMCGSSSHSSSSFKVVAGFESKKSGERQEYLRCTQSRGEKGETIVQPIRNQSSGVAASLSQADGLAIVPPHTAVKVGDSLEFISLSSLLY